MKTIKILWFRKNILGIWSLIKVLDRNKSALKHFTSNDFEYFVHNGNIDYFCKICDNKGIYIGRKLSKIYGKTSAKTTKGIKNFLVKKFF